MATSYKRADVYIKETLTQANPSFFPASSAVAFVGYARRGPIGPTLIDSWLTYQRLFGDFVGGADDDLAYAVYAYFQNGGNQCYVVRTTGAGVATATRTLNDRAGTPAPVLIVTAANPGAWGNRVAVEVVDTLVPGVFNLNVYYTPVAGGTAQLVEHFDRVSLDPNSDRNVLGVVNSRLTGSRFITLAQPANWVYTSAAISVPAVSTVGGDVLSAGADSSARPTVGAAGQIMVGVNLLNTVPDGFLLNVVSVTDAATLNAAIGYCETRGDSMLFIDPQLGRTSSQAVTDASALNRSSYAATYWPNLWISDPATITPGTMRLVSPVPSVLGQVVRTDATRGVYKAPAGTATALRGVMALEIPSPQLNDFDVVAAGQVNAIRFFTGSGFCVWGSATLKQGQADGEISIRRTLMALEAAIVQVTRFAAFEPNDELLWGELTSACDGVLRNLWQTGGLRGSSQQQAYYIVCDDTNNTPSAIQAGEAHVDIGVALQYPAKFIVISIGQFEAGASVSANI